MSGMIRPIHHFLTGDAAATSVEYAVMLALIVTVLFVVVASIGMTASGDFSAVSGALTSAPS